MTHIGFVQISEVQLTGNRSLIENGLKHLACLIGSIVFHPSTPIVIADDSRRCVEASMGACKRLGLSREEIIGRHLDEFMMLDAVPHFRKFASPIQINVKPTSSNRTKRI